MELIRRLPAFVFLLLINALAGVLHIYATTVTNTNDSGPGSLRQAITDTPAGGTVDFALTGCPCTITLTTGHLEVSKSLTIIGPSADLLTVSGGNNSRVFFLNGGVGEFRQMTIESLNVANGAASGPFPWPGNQGGGIYTYGNVNYKGQSSLTVVIKNTKISGNQGNGGGIHASSTNLIIENSTISGNASTFYGGAGLHFDWYNRVRIKNSSIVGHTATGIFRVAGMYSINYNDVELEDVTIEGNVGGSSSIIGNVWSTLRITNCTISGNSGLAIASFSDDPIDAPLAPSLLTITSSTITDNSEGVYTAQFHPCCPAQTTLRNSIVANNGEDAITEGSGKFISEGYNLIGNAGSVPTFIQPGDQAGMPGSPIVPRLEPLAFYGGPTKTHALKFDSPARDKGKVFGSTTDQRGLMRPYDAFDIANAVGGDGSDIGAFESQFAISATGTISGRVSSQGMAMRPRGYVTLTDSDQNVRLSTISSFGYYVFYDVPLDQMFTINLRSKGWSIDPQQIFTNESAMNLDLVAIFAGR